MDEFDDLIKQASKITGYKPKMPARTSAPTRSTQGWWTPERVDQAVNHLQTNAKLSPIGAKGLVARWAGVEAGGGPTAVNPSSKAFGIAQWLGSRKKGVPADFEGQLNYAVKELNSTESVAAKRLRQAQTEEDAAIGASMFERAEGYNPKTGRDNFVNKTIHTLRKFGGSTPSPDIDIDSLMSQASKITGYGGQIDVDALSKQASAITGYNGSTRAPTPELPQTLNAQRQAMHDANSSRIGTLYTDGTMAGQPNEVEIDIPISNGQILRVNRDKFINWNARTGVTVADLQNGADFTPLIGGKIEPTGEQYGTQGKIAVVTTDENGTELVSSAVTNPVNVPLEAALQKKQFPGMATQTKVVSSDDVVAMRLPDIARVARPDMLPPGQDALPVPQSAPPAVPQVPVQRDVNAEYADFLKQVGIPDSNEARAEFNLAQKASVKGANEQNKLAYAEDKANIDAYNASLPKQTVKAAKAPQTSQTPSARSIKDLSGTIEFPKGADPRKVAEDAAMKLLSEAGYDVNGEDVQTAIRNNSNLDWTDTELTELQKTGGKIPFSIGKELIGEVLKAKEQIAKRKERKAAFEIKRKEYAETGIPESILEPGEQSPVAGDILAAMESGLIGTQKGRELLIEENRAYRNELAKQGLSGNDARMIASAMQTQGGNEFVDIRRKRIDELIQKTLTDYGSFKGRKTEQERIAKEYENRPLAEPLEFAKSLFSAVPKAVASVLKTADIALNLRPGNYTMQETILSEIGDGINTYLESAKNKDFKDKFWITTFPDTLGQLGTQIAAGVLSGGATVPTLIGSSMGAAAQYDEAKKLGANDRQKLLTSVVGALAAVPDAILFRKWFAGADSATKTGFFKNLTQSIMKKLGVQYGDDVAKTVTRDVMLQFTGKYLKSSLGEGIQEVSENKINDWLALKTYDPSAKREAKLYSVTDEDITSFVAGMIGGGAGAAVQTTTSKLSKDNMPDFIDKAYDEIDRLVEAGEIEPAKANEVKKTVAKVIGTKTLKPLETEAAKKPVDIPGIGTTKTGEPEFTKAETAPKPRSEVKERGTRMGLFPKKEVDKVTEPTSDKVESTSSVSEPDITPTRVDAPRGVRKATAEGKQRIETAQEQLRTVINNPDIVGKQRADMIANGRKLVQFLTANATKPLDTTYHNGDQVALTGDNAKDGFQSVIYLEGPKAGQYAEIRTADAKAADVAKEQQAFKQQQEAFGRVRESGLSDQMPKAPAPSQVEAEAKEPWELAESDYSTNRLEQLREMPMYRNAPEQYKRQLDKSESKKFSKEWYDANEKAFIKGETVQWKPAWSITAQQMADRSDDTLDSYIKDAHRKSVQEALAEGKPVPAEVLADYPDLASPPVERKAPVNAPAAAYKPRYDREMTERLVESNTARIAELQNDIKRYDPTSPVGRRGIRDVEKQIQTTKRDLQGAKKDLRFYERSKTVADVEALPKKSVRQPKKSTRSLSQYLRGLGGARATKYDKGEVRRASNKETGTTGLVNKNSQYTAEQAAVSAWESGYLRDVWPDAADIDGNAFMDFVEEDYRGIRKYYPQGEETETTYSEADQENLYFADQSRNEDIERRLQGLSEQGLKEFDNLAALMNDDTPAKLILYKAENLPSGISQEERVKFIRRAKSYGVSRQHADAILAITAKEYTLRENQAAASEPISESTGDDPGRSGEQIYGSKPATAFDQTNLFGEKVTPQTSQPGLQFGVPKFSDSGRLKDMEEAYGKRTADYIEALTNSQDAELYRVAIKLSDARLLVLGKRGDAKAIVEDAADALDIFAKARQTQSTVDDIIRQNRMDDVKFSTRALDYAREMEKSASAFSTAFTNDLSEAKTDRSAPLLSVAPNASGESPALLEAQSRLRGERARNERRVVVDTRSGIERPLIGVDAVDYNPRPFETVEWRGGNKDGDVIARGLQARDYKRREPLRSVAERQTDTPAFKKWFGDSKVVDDKGNPLRVYRGDVEHKKGIFFTSSTDTAEGYARSTFFRGGNAPQTTAVYLSLQNPLIIDALGKRNDNIPVPWSEWQPKVFGNLPDTAVNVEDAYAYALANGHDGLIVKNVVDTADPTERAKPSDVYAVKEQAQIKSATGNRGTFDPNDPNILRATHTAEGSPELEALTQVSDFSTIIPKLDTTVQTDEFGGDILKFENNESLEVARTLYANIANIARSKVPPIDGMFLDRDLAKTFREAAEGMMEDAESAGVDAKPLKALVKNIDAAMKENGTIRLASERSLKHETGHSIHYLQSGGKAIRERYTDFDALYKANEPFLKKFYAGYFKRSYFNGKNYNDLTSAQRTTLFEEARQRILGAEYGNEITDLEAATFFENEMDAYVEKNGHGILDDYERLLGDAKTKQKQVIERIKNRGKPESADTGVQEGEKAQEQDTAGEGVPGTEAKQKDRQFAVSMAQAGLDIGDVKYDPQTFKGELAKAYDHLDRTGVDQAMDDWAKVTDAAQKMALGTVIAYELKVQNRIPDLIAFGEQLTVNSGSHGAGLVFSKLMTRLSPAFAQIEANKRVRKHQKRPATPEELQKIDDLSTKLEKATNQYEMASAALDEADAQLEKADKTIERLNKALETEQSPPTKEELQKRLQKAQRQASYYLKSLVEERRKTQEKYSRQSEELKQIEAEKDDLLQQIGGIFNTPEVEGLFMVAGSHPEPDLDIPGAEALVKLSALKLSKEISRGLTTERFDAWLKRLTNDQLSQNDIETIHALAMNKLTGDKTPMTDEAKAKVQNRLAHVKRAYNNLHNVEAEQEQRRIESLDRQIEKLEAAEVKEVGKVVTENSEEVTERKEKLKELRRQRKEILESRRGETSKYDDLAKMMIGLGHQLGTSPEGMFLGAAMRTTKDPRALQHTFKQFYPDSDFNKALVEGHKLLQAAEDTIKQQKADVEHGRKLTTQERRHIEWGKKRARNEQRLGTRALEAELKQLERKPIIKVGMGVLDIWNGIRAIMYSVDAGAALAPGVLTLTTSPTTWVRSLRDAGTAFESKHLNQYLRKYGKLAEDEGISSFVRKAIPGFDKLLRRLGMNNTSFEQMVTQHWDEPARARAESQGLKLEEIGSKRDWNEGRMSNIAEAIPIVGHSNRFHGLATDLMRKGHAQRFIRTLDKLESAGKITAEDRMAAEDFLMRKWANVITGKGYLGMVEPAAWAASQVMSAPRFMASAFQVPYYANPIRIAMMPKGARRIVAADAAKIYGVVSALVALFGYLGWINLDPEDKDFLTLNANKIPGVKRIVPDMKIKPVRWLQEPVRLTAGLLMKYAYYMYKGDKDSQTRIEREWYDELVASDFGGIGNFWKGRLHPSIGLIKTNVTGKNFVGEPVGWEDVGEWFPLPLTIGEGIKTATYDKKQSILKTGDMGDRGLSNNWARVLATMTLNGVGFGVSSYPGAEPTVAGKQAVSMMTGDDRTEKEKEQSQKANQLERLVRDGYDVNAELQNALASDKITAKQAEALAGIIADEVGATEAKFGIQFKPYERQWLMQNRRAFKLLDYLWGGEPYKLSREKIEKTLKFADRGNNWLNDRAAQAEAEGVLLRALLRSNKTSKAK